MAKKRKKKKEFKPLETNKWEDERYIIEASVFKTGRTEGVAVRSAKKYLNRSPMIRKSFYIHKNQKVSEILDWLYVTVKTFFSKFWGRKIITKEDIKQKDKLIDDLRIKLREREDESTLLKQTLKSQQDELRLASEVIDKTGNYIKILDNFEKRIKKSVKNKERIEEWIKEEIKNNRWLLGLDCEVKAKNQDIDIKTEIDLHIVTNYGEQRIIEVKSPNIDIFTAKKEGGRLNINLEIARGLSELIEYMRRTDISSGLKSKGTYAIQKPIGRILAGYNLSADGEEALNEWNFYLAPYIKIITFKEMISSARKEIDLIVTAEKVFKKLPEPGID